MSHLVSPDFCDTRGSRKGPLEWRNHRVSWRPRGRSISTAKDFDVSFAFVLKRIADNYACIDINPDILGGTPRITDTRIPVYMILDAIEHYGSLDGVLTSYPHLTMTQIKDAVSFATEVLEHKGEYQP